MARDDEETTPSCEAAAAEVVAAMEEASRARGEDTAAMVDASEVPEARDDVGGGAVAVEGEDNGVGGDDAAAMEVDSSSAITPAQEGVVGDDLMAVRGAGEGLAVAESTRGGLATVGDEGDGEVVRRDSGLAAVSRDTPDSEMGVSGSGGDAMSNRGDAAGTPDTPTVEDLLAAAERVSGERREGGGEEVVTAGCVSATPVLRATVAGSRGGDNGIGASGPVPLTEGDFLDTARPQDILDALGLDAGIRKVLRGARNTEDQTPALLLEALLSGAGVTAADTGSPEVADLGQEEEVVIEERVTAAAEAKAFLARARPGFTPDTYAPRLHFFEPTGMTGYVPARTDYPEDLLLRDRASHISSGWTTELVEEAGFGPFIQLLTAVRVDRAVMTALAERWWDTTNTFHFRFGEMMVTPLDFAAITGLRVGGEPIPFDSTIDLDDAALKWFLGRVPRHNGGVAEYGQFTTYWEHEPVDDVEVAQMARAYLMYLFGASLFPLRRSRVHLSYLAGLVDLRLAGRFDWGGAALCTLYCFLGAASREVGDTIGGY
ncbi:hypothetical protein RHMOL_Rhmol04G0151600 [Rhododendron molle]|uniref:Uncharacterized protein n=1 Tax=Rhododendron molle TaxID=49168 RepID=A0ACC0P2G5_RHOML|nr:hypothetical protein RHMOL_Rhmol04G0151600 [Rhododendron molle]